MPRRVPRPDIILCEVDEDRNRRTEHLVEELKRQAPAIAGFGDAAEFWRSGIFHSAIEKLRGAQSASTEEKRQFMAEVLDYLRDHARLIAEWSFEGSGERYDYVVTLPDRRVSIIEAKGCLDGNNTNIFQRPPQADEFVIWSLCQNPSADPRHNAWSGIHTRLGAEIINRQQRVDGLVIWDMLCGTPRRLCPKTQQNPNRYTRLPSGRLVPPPCLYLFPRSVPDPRNNPKPRQWELGEVGLLAALWRAFGGDERDVVRVEIATRMDGVNVIRTTAFWREGRKIAESRPTILKRASR